MNETMSFEQALVYWGCPKDWDPALDDGAGKSINVRFPDNIEMAERFVVEGLLTLEGTAYHAENSTENTYRLTAEGVRRVLYFKL